MVRRHTWTRRLHGVLPWGVAFGILAAIAAIVVVAWQVGGPVASGVTPALLVRAAPAADSHAVAPAAVAASRDPRAPLEPSVPVRLTIAGIGVDADLMRLGLQADGTMEVPPGAFPAGWFVGAPTPGELGPAVIAGHVDSNGPGVFHDLHRVNKGDVVDVARADGSVAHFVVTKVGRYAKNKFPSEAVYGAISHAGLRIITCGGVWDAGTGHYRDNLVVFAALDSSTPGPTATHRP